MVVIGDDRVVLCAGGVHKVGKRVMRHNVANKSAFFIWFA